MPKKFDIISIYHTKIDLTSEIAKNRDCSLSKNTGKTEKDEMMKSEMSTRHFNKTIIMEAPAQSHADAAILPPTTMESQTDLNHCRTNAHQPQSPCEKGSSVEALQLL